MIRFSTITSSLSFLAYPLDGARERYFNDGIVKHFDYDALITGTSMTENFRASECDALFGVNSIKVPFSGGSVTELSDTIRSALQKNPNLKLVICSIDELRLYQEQGYKQYDCPEYLYDNNYFNDVNYLLNKSILFRYSLAALEYTQEGHASTTFDEYGFWGSRKGISTDGNGQ